MIIATVGANMSDQKSKAAVELQSFKDAELWKGGFLDCDPINPLMWSSYTTNGFVSIYHAIYWAAIKPYMPQAARVLEIGPGHGAWTRALIHGGAAKVIGLDVQAREFNGIDMWLGEDASKLDYYVVEDMTCSMVEDDSIDFFWSGGAFVHMSKYIISEYVASMHKKMRQGAHGFIQYADIDVYNNIVTNKACMIHSVISEVMGPPEGPRLKEAMSQNEHIRSRDVVPEEMRNWEDVSPGRYFFVGQRFMAECLSAAGFEVVDPFFMPSLRDPIIHFRKI
ncbi:class I SAM-dependent methyltransferase [Methylobacterium oryzae]|uniref:class I SAM-dependent methyltransferase n=1 Tax=Methylobacterium oryzae TaxID=334852 RepID=UPI000C2A8F9A|nr:class I SAM-dependent methyltransferase [Methylobacterium oryzae]